jgi:murein DD-endopeptidase MepM/ murein hydrolase activator NlpD
MRILITLVTVVLSAAMAVAGGGGDPAAANGAAPCAPGPGRTASAWSQQGSTHGTGRVLAGQQGTAHGTGRVSGGLLGMWRGDGSGSASPPGTSAGIGSVWTWPLGTRLGAEGSGAPVILRPFEQPMHRWDPGHRGVDLAGVVGERVLAAGAGAVLFAGRVVDQGVVVVGHGAVRTSYEPVSALVTVGESVEAGQTLGTLDPGHCAQAACLHWGLLTGHDHATVYYDPLLLLGCGAVRLEPLS